MAPLELTKLRQLVNERNWHQAAESLRSQTSHDAADALMSLSFEQQKTLLGHLPVDFAGALIPALPYFHAYVLLFSLPAEEMRGILRAMNVSERDQFLEELPEEAWRTFVEASSVLPPAAPGETVAAPLPAGEIALKPAEPQLPEGPILEARQVEKGYEQPDGHKIPVLGPLDLSLEAGTVLALLGPSGSGKSTLLRILSGLTEPTTGEVFWHGLSLGRCKPNVGIVFQSFALFPWLTVLENVEAPLLARAMPHEQRHERALHALNVVGLANFETAYPKELSGGMKQRVGFARALAVEPEVLFMDEPFSALDVLTAENLRGDLLELWREKKIPTRSIFLVTHNIEEAVLLADRIVVLGGSPAKIRADFNVPLAQPRDRQSAAFLVYVDYIYKVMTQPELTLAPPCGPAEKIPLTLLPHSRPGGVAGLLELLVDRKGEEDIYHIAEDLLMEVDDLLPIIEAAALLGFAATHHGDVTVTPEGRAFAEADIAERKKLFRHAALERVPLLQRMHSALKSKSDHSMPLEFFRDLLDEHFGTEEVERQIETALDWGRYADLFTYDRESDRLSLYEPEGRKTQRVALH